MTMTMTMNTITIMDTAITTTAITITAMTMVLPTTSPLRGSHRCHSQALALSI